MVFRLHRQPASPAVSPGDLLPAELWDSIAQELPEVSLSRLAMTCRALNDRCMAIYLLRKGIPALSLASGNHSIRATLIEALQLVYEHLRSLRSLVARAQSLRQLELRFPGELSRCSTASPDLGLVPQEVLVNLFCDIVYSIAHRASGTVVVVTPEGIHSCRPGDISRWKLRESYFTRGLSNYILCAYTSTTIHLRGGSSSKVFPLRSIRSAHIYEIPSIGSTLIVLNQASIASLVLGGSTTSQGCFITSTQLSAVLPHITLPELCSITLNTDRIDPADLSPFLARHEGISTLKFDAVSCEAPASPLLTPAVALPLLHTFSSPHPANIIRLLDSLDTSPSLSNIGFTYDRSSPDSIATLSTLFRRLGQRTQSVHLQLVLTTSNSPPLNATERTIAGTLSCVRSVKVTGLQQATARVFLLWLALLPRLVMVDFELAMTATSTEVKAEFMREVRAVLLPRVDIRLWDAKWA
ncbi:hypothetical protein K438DRAFT_1987773 [Mycena galopus ATCC 62051]|nr:hypothetical protein K438DRAFT_1987773 [Mycena galopus ATCC 62051]